MPTFVGMTIARVVTTNGTYDGRGEGHAGAESLHRLHARLNKAEADIRAQTLRPLLLDIVGDRDDMSTTAIAAELNRRKVDTLRPGSRWHAQTVIRVMRRLGMEQSRQSDTR
jgi:DNA-binding phage protein